MNHTALFDFLTSRVGLFAEFPAERVRDLIAGSTLATFEPNEAIIEFGEEGRFLGVLTEGQAEASMAHDDGERQRLSELKPGDFFGEIALMTGDHTIADIIAVTRCTVLVIPQALFSSALITHPPAVKLLAKSIRDRLQKWTSDKTGRKLADEALHRSDDPYHLKLRTDNGAKILVVNCGSSSLKYSLFDTADESGNVSGSVENVNGKQLHHTIHRGNDTRTLELEAGGYKEAFGAMVAQLLAGDRPIIRSAGEIAAVGHRVVHGGEKFSSPAMVNDEVLRQIEELSALAPLHNPVNIEGIRAAQWAFPAAVHVAVFDTTFHHTLPPYAYLYGLPYEYYEKYGIRRYGFHGTSHLYVSLKAAEFLKRPFNELEIVSCHLGNGASVCAVDHGRSVDTSMGLTPTEGLIMGTRCGSIDPAALIMLMRKEAMSPEQINEMINKKSGLLGLSGISNDMRAIMAAADEGHHRALLAVKSFCYGIRKYIGAYVAAMQGLDVVIFTGGIGENSPGVRSLACQRLDYMGITIDEAKNRAAATGTGVADIAVDGAPVRVLVVHTEEERMIARETLRVIDLNRAKTIIDKQEPMPLPIEVSAHHVHLNTADVAALFGAGHELTPASPLSQPGQFACVEQVNLVGPKGRVDRVRVLGPARKETQIEIAMTEQFKLGIHPPIRESGDIENTPGITLEGSAGTITKSKGVMCALRHIHMAPEDALRFGVRDKDIVRVRVAGDRELVFGDVLIRVNASYKLAMHIDTDEANAAHITTGTTGFVEGIQSRG
jgi:acetate kinase